MFSWYYMSLFLILIFFSFLFFCPGVSNCEKWWLCPWNYSYLPYKQVKKNPILVPLRPLTITIKLIGIQFIRNVIKYVKLCGNQMSTKVVTCISSFVKYYRQHPPIIYFFHLIYFTPVMIRIWCKVFGVYYVCIC